MVAALKKMTVNLLVFGSARAAGKASETKRQQMAVKLWGDALVELGDLVAEQRREEADVVTAPVAKGLTPRSRRQNEKMTK